MTTPSTRMNAAVAAALATLISACSIAHLGWLRNSPDVSRAFETLQVSPDDRYWYLYLENTPYAVLGLNRDYRIEDIQWTEVTPGSEVFQKVAWLVQNFPGSGFQNLRRVHPGCKRRPDRCLVFKHERRHQRRPEHQGGLHHDGHAVDERRRQR